MKYVIPTLLVVSFILAAPAALKAKGDDTTVYNAGFGFAATASMNQAVEIRDSKSFRSFGTGGSYGGGFVFEKMFTNYVGIQSGMYIQSYELPVRFKFYAGIPDIPVRVSTILRAVNISIPMTVLFSVNVSFFSVNFAAGVRVCYMVDPTFTNKNINVPNYHNRISSLPAIHNFMFGLTGGVYFRFRMTENVDAFFGPDANIYLTETFKDDKDLTSLYQLSLTAGFMFRTDVFPMKSEMHSIK